MNKQIKYIFTLSLAALLSACNSGKNVEPIKYTVIFTDSNGEIYETQEVKDGEKATKPAVDPVENYYDFNGWYLNSECTVEFDFNTLIHHDLTIYSYFTPHHYKITYHNDDGLENNNPDEYTYGEGVETLTDAVDPNEKVKFYGWYREETFENKVTSISVIEHEDIDLYAKREDIYTITYENWPEDISNHNPKTYTSLDAITFTLKDFDNYPGFRCLSFMENEKEVTGIPLGSKGDKVITLDYELTSSTVTLNPNGGTVMPLNKFIYIDDKDGTEKRKIALDDSDDLNNIDIYNAEKYSLPAKEGKRFAGYYFDENYERLISFENTSNLTVLETIYAKWEDLDPKVDQALPYSGRNVSVLPPDQMISNEIYISIPESVTETTLRIFFPGEEYDNAQQAFAILGYKKDGTAEMIANVLSSSKDVNFNEHINVENYSYICLSYSAESHDHPVCAYYDCFLDNCKYKEGTVKLEPTGKTFTEVYEYWSIPNVIPTKKGQDFEGWFDYNGNRIVLNSHFMETKSELSVRALWW